jgi:hypothetical protein
MENNTLPGKRFTHWEYIVDDLLEMACTLTRDERLFLLDEMQIRSCVSESIQAHPSFSLDGRLVVVAEDSAIEECWIYYPALKRIEKYPLKRKK